MATPLSAKPLITRTEALLPVTFRSQLSVTASSVPMRLVGTNSLPSAVVMTPPLTVPPANRHEPVAALSAKTPAVSSSVPVKLTVPPVRLKVPSPAHVKAPPRFVVALVAVIVPALVQLPLRVNVPLLATTVP